MTREQLIKARDEMPENSHGASQYLIDHGDLIRTLINNALEEPIEGLAEAVELQYQEHTPPWCAFIEKYGDTPRGMITKAARRQLNQGETK